MTRNILYIPYTCYRWTQAFDMSYLKEPITHQMHFSHCLSKLILDVNNVYMATIRTLTSSFLNIHDLTINCARSPCFRIQILLVHCVPCVIMFYFHIINTTLLVWLCFCELIYCDIVWYNLLLVYYVILL